MKERKKPSLSSSPGRRSPLRSAPESEEISPSGGMLQITEENFEELLKNYQEAAGIDLRSSQFIDPYCMVGILGIGEALKADGIIKTLHLPQSPEALKSLERMDFLRLAEEYFVFDPAVPNKVSGRRNGCRDVLLEITPIEKPEDVHRIVGRVRERAQAVLAVHLRYDEKAIRGFASALSEVSQNIVEHSRTRGFVGIHKYRFQGMNRNAVRITVMDTGIGFAGSLSERFLLRNDLHALEIALLKGESRHIDPGRGRGLAAVKRFVKRWDGKLSVRSGTARLSMLPRWAKGKEKEMDLSFFPGTQINILLPELS